MKRKNFIKSAGVAAASLAIFPGEGLVAMAGETKIRMATIGVGLMKPGNIIFLSPSMKQ